MAKQPTSVRWDEEKLSLVMENEKLSSVQKVFTFLLDKYWWESKISFHEDYSKLPSNFPKVQTMSESETVEFREKALKNHIKKYGVTEYATKNSSDIADNVPKMEESEILQKIAVIRSEKIPAERNTSLGKKVWANEQYKRIKELENQIKN
jgi:hypothetical protein